MKSLQTSVLLHVFEGLITDASRAYPELSDGFAKDKASVARYFRSRGEGVFTLDLPSLDQLLCSGLERGSLSLQGPLSRAYSKKVHVPRLFSGLWLLIFERDSSLKPDVDVNAVLFLRQFCRLGKNMLVECSKKRLHATIGEYHNVEVELRVPSEDWTRDSILGSSTKDHCFGDLGADLDTDCRMHDDQWRLPLGCSERSEGISVYDRRLLEQLQHVADAVSTTLGTFDTFSFSFERASSEAFVGFKHGRGAVADRQNREDKFAFPYWPHKLERTFPFGLTGKLVNDDRSDPVNHEVASRLIAVPKSAKAPRLIASEPSQHQWCQQQLWAWLENRCSTTWISKYIDFRDQDASAKLVLTSSLDRKLATVDLSSASDRLSCWTVERMFRKNTSLLTALHAARTRWIRSDMGSQSSFIKLKKFASQGTATTFPVQTICYLVIALTALLGDRKITMARLKEYGNQVRIYGDDIILPRYGYARLTRLMTLLQLKVNDQKSYKDGHFRESCGTDGYNGHNVTPVSPKVFVADGPASVVAVVDTANNFFMKGFWHASHNLLTHLHPRIRRGLRVVKPDAGCFGLTSYVGSYEDHLDKRWNSSLHRTEVRTWRTIRQVRKRDREGFSVLLDFLTRSHNHEQARIVSTSDGGEPRLRMQLTWEPSTDCNRSDFELPFKRVQVRPFLHHSLRT